MNLGGNRRGPVVFCLAVLLVLASNVALGQVSCDEFKEPQLRARMRLIGKCREDLVRVPMVVGKTVQDAVGSLKNARLSPVERYETAPPADAGRVVKQSVEPDTEAAPGTSVTLTIGYSTKLRIPNVVGSDLPNAKLLLRGFGVNTQEIQSDKPLGEIILQDPPAETLVERGTTVTVTLSTGIPAKAPPNEQAPKDTGKQREEISARVLVPNVVDLTESEARAALKGVRISIERVKRIADVRPAGVVANQFPIADVLVPAATKITLSVSDGSIVLVPNVVGMKVDEALDALTATGQLRPTYRWGIDWRWVTVGESRPSAGSFVRRGTVVNLSPAREIIYSAAAAATAVLAAVFFGGWSYVRRRPVLAPVPLQESLTRPQLSASEPLTSTPEPIQLNVHFSVGFEYNVRDLEASESSVGAPEARIKATFERGPLEVWEKQEKAQ